jgi:hypothetical protein
MRSAQARWAAAAAVLVIVLVAVWWTRRGTPAAATPHAATAPRTAAVKPWAVRTPPAIAKLEAGRTVDRSRAGLWMLEDPGLPIVVADALINGRFPRWSHPLQAGMVDLLEPNARADTCAAPQHADRSYGDPSLCILFTADKYRLLGDQPLYVTIEVLRGQAHVPARIVHAAATEVEYLSRKPVGAALPLTFADQGGSVYATTFATKDTPFADHFGIIDLDVELEVDGQRYAATLDVWNQPESAVPARFAPPFRDVVTDGSLTIHVGVDVTIAGSYVVDANLFDAAGAPVAFMHQVSDLPAGHSEIPLLVFGRVIREKDASGPYSLANLRGYLFLLGKDPDRQLMPDYPGEYVTAPYQATDFSDAEFWDAFKQQSIDDLLEAAATGSHGMTKTTLEHAGETGWTPSW